MSVADELVIFWNSEDGQEETRGLYLYSLTLLDAANHDLELVKAAWNPMSVRLQDSVIEAELGKVLVVAVAIESVPDSQHWRSNLDRSLSVLLSFGGIVAWIGGEDCSWSPDVLDPESGIGNVLAAKCDSTGFMCNANINESTVFLNDSQLASLWSFVKTKTAGQ
jgi:hypothetical protein